MTKTNKQEKKNRDVLRVRLAINHAETLSSATSTARTIFHREGLKSFYSGLGTTLLVFKNDILHQKKHFYTN